MKCFFEGPFNGCSRYPTKLLRRQTDEELERDGGKLHQLILHKDAEIRSQTDAILFAGILDLL